MAAIDPDGLAKRAAFLFMAEGKACSEAMLLAAAEALEIESDLIPDIATGFAGGMGMRGNTCGVVAGAIMAVSLAASRAEPDVVKKKGRAIAAAARTEEQLSRRFGATDCRTLCGLDLTTSEGLAALRSGIKAEKCKPLVEQGARILAGQLRDV